MLFVSALAYEPHRDIGDWLTEDEALDLTCWKRSGLARSRSAASRCPLLSVRTLPPSMNYGTLTPLSSSGRTAPLNIAVSGLCLYGLWLSLSHSLSLSRILSLSCSLSRSRSLYRSLSLSLSLNLSLSRNRMPLSMCLLCQCLKQMA